MKRLLFALMLVCVGCEMEPPFLAPLPPEPPIARPVVNVPRALRESNWLGPQREGSCVHAAIVNLLRAQRMFARADWWRSHNGDGEWDERLASKLDAAGIKYTYTSEHGNVGFLEWACDPIHGTRRGCGVTVEGGRHMVCLMHLDDKWAGILDSNSTDAIIWVPRETFIAEWLNSNSWAVAIVGTPAPPRPAKQ